MLRILLLLLVAVTLASCSHQYLMKDCVQEGNSVYSKCRKLSPFDIGKTLKGRSDDSEPGKVEG